MITYPFSAEPKENDFPGNKLPGNENDRKSLVFKNGINIIEYDIDVVLEYFPHLRNEGDGVIKAFLNSVNQSIVQVK